MASALDGVVNAPPQPLYPGEGAPVPTVQKTGWASKPVWPGTEHLASTTGFLTPDSPASSKVAIYIYTVKPRYSASVRRNLWSYIEGGGKSEYCLVGSFCLQVFMGAKWGWRYIRVGGALYRSLLYVCIQREREVFYLTALSNAKNVRWLSHKLKMITGH